MAIHTNTIDPEILIPIAARKFVLQGERESIFGSVIYKIARDGIADLLALDQRITVVHTTTALDKALQDESVFSVLVPRTAPITLDVARRYLTSTVQKKSLFWEDAN